MNEQVDGKHGWTDQVIDRTVAEHSMYRVANSIQCMSQATAHSLLMEMRDSYEQRIADLEAQLVAAQELLAYIDTVARRWNNERTIVDG